MGKSWANTIENCMNAGKINQFDNRDSVGNIVGYATGYTEGYASESPVTIKHCY